MHCKQLAAHDVQVAPESRYPELHTEHVVVTPEVLQVLHPVGQIIQFP